MDLSCQQRGGKVMEVKYGFLNEMQHHKEIHLPFMVIPL